MQKLPVRTSLLLAFVLILAGGCGTTPAQSDSSNTPTVAANTPPEEPPTVSIPMGTLYPKLLVPVPTTQVPSGPAPTPERRIPDARGSDPEADALAQKWREAIRSLMTLRGNQTRMLIDPDGTRRPPTKDEAMIEKNFDEMYDLTNIESVRYRVVMHSPLGYEMVLFDGKGDYRLWSWVEGEVYRPLPEGRSASLYWVDDVGEITMLNGLIPQEATYRLVGRSEIEGHRVAELVVESGSSNSYWTVGTRIFLDEANYLPYRIILYPRDDVDKNRLPAREHTFNNLVINQPIEEAEYREGLPASKDVTTIYQQGAWTPGLPTYPSLYDEKLQPGFVLFEPGYGTVDEIATIALIEQNGNGKRTPMLSLERGTIIESVYLPRIEADSRQGYTDYDALEKVLHPQGETIEVNGAPATIYDVNGQIKLRMQREGTWIEVRAQTRDQAMQIAQGLRPIRRWFDK